MAILHDDEPAQDFAAPPTRFPVAKAAVAGICLLATLWFARDLPVARWFGGSTSPAPVAVVRAQPATSSTIQVPPAQAATSAPGAIAVPPPLAAAGPAATVQPSEPVAGTDPARATLIDQIGALQMQIVLARMKRELAQAQAETAKLMPDAPGGEAVEALLDRMAERDAPRTRSLAVQAVFGRDGDWAARLLLPGEGARVVRKGDVIADRWRVDAIDERAVILVATQGEARQVLRPGAGTPRAGDYEADEPAPRPAPKPAAATPPASAADAAIGQAPVAGSMLRPR